MIPILTQTMEIHTAQLTHCKFMQNYRKDKFGYVLYFRDEYTNELFLKFVWEKESSKADMVCNIQYINTRMVNQQVMFETLSSRKSMWHLCIVGGDENEGPK